MKKLLTFAVVAMLAAVTQATTVGWTISNAGAAYTGDAYQFFIIGQNGVTSVSQITALLDAGTDTSSYAFGAGTLTLRTGGVTMLPASTGKTLTEVGTYTSFAVIFNAATPVAGSSEYLAISGLANQTKEIGASTANVSFATGSVNALASDASNWSSYGPVPEPCTAALLAIGLAAFGLKRKVTK